MTHLWPTQPDDASVRILFYKPKDASPGLLYSRRKLAWKRVFIPQLWVVRPEALGEVEVVNPDRVVLCNKYRFASAEGSRLWIF